MKTFIRQGVLTALSSISHIGETRGIESMLRREKVVLESGEVEEIPIISGNAIRGLLRDRGMLHFCSALGYGVSETEDDTVVRGLSLAAFYFLFSGGALTKGASTKGIDVDRARELRDLIPLVSLFGGAMGDQILPGKLKVGKVIPICSETIHLLPEWCWNRAKGSYPSVWEYLQKEPYTRRDDAKNEPIRPLIAAPERLAMEEAGSKKLEQKRSGEYMDTEGGTHQQMRYFVETFAQGTPFFWELVLEDPSEVEYDALHITLVEFARMPYIGGKSAIGHGKIKIEFNAWLQIDPNRLVDQKEIGTPMGQAYRAHLETHGTEIREALDAIG